LSYKLICTFTQAAQALDARSYYYYFFNLYENVQHVKRDIFTADIYYYITNEFGYAKCDLHIWWCCVAYGGVVLRFQFIKVCMGKNGDRHYSKNFDIFAIKMTYLNALSSFLLSSRFSA